jgi:hypothetical protein
MNYGSPIAIGFFGAVVAGCIFGLACDVRQWWRTRGWRRDEQRMLALIAVWDDALPALTEEELEACERAMAAVVTLAEIDALSLYDAADWASV